ncbi:MAG: ABC transporter ATP-binding protein [Sphaerobacter sp.]|nr:ABC transporter ATP-binding protein [Sphaerobacter sp.]
MHHTRPAPSGGTPLLEIDDLAVRFATRRGEVRAVDGVSLRLHEGEILGIVGESGSGKSMTLLSILRLIPRQGRIARGAIRYRGQNLLDLPMRAMRALRGRDIAMVFQDPMTTLNPVFPVGEQIREALRIHGLLNQDRKRRWPQDLFDRRLLAAERDAVVRVMQEVGIPAPALRYRDYPHQFSGGMQQRALIAIALACRPRILLADEPTTALDVTIQAQILDLMRQINRDHGTSIILVTHDLAVAAEFCDRIAVMYAGRIVESGATADVLFRPQHPYTEGLLRSIPRLDGDRAPLEPIPGEVPDLAALPSRGCPFAPRCHRAVPDCVEQDPPWVAVGPQHYARCLLHGTARPERGA